jgi:hypothetical protein
MDLSSFIFYFYFFFFLFKILFYHSQILIPFILKIYNNHWTKILIIKKFMILFGL